MQLQWVLSSMRFTRGLIGQGFTDRAISVLAIARRQAIARRDREISPEHVLLGLACVERGVGFEIFRRLGIDLAQEREQIAALIAVPQSRLPIGGPAFGPEAKRLVAEARAKSRELGVRYVGTEHLALALLGCGPCPAVEYLRSRRVTAEGFLRALADLHVGD